MSIRRRDAATHWTLPDLVDFEVTLAHGAAEVTPADRHAFLRDVRPRLVAIKDAAEQRRLGLRLWLEAHRSSDTVSVGQWFGRAVGTAGWAVCALWAFIGMGLATGLMLGGRHQVQVVIFIGVTLLLPWLVFAAGVALHLSGVGRGGLRMLAELATRLFAGRNGQRADRRAALEALTGSRTTRRVLAALVAGLTQRAAIGFNIGLILAFAGCLLLFDIRFYWAATPQAGMDSLLSVAVQIMAVPWHWLWPQAVPGMTDIAATRLAAGAVPVVGNGSWWRFLLMALLVWGLVPRLVLVFVFAHVRRRALAALDFQAPRHRMLWRGLNAIERGEVASGPVDGVLVLDVGGHGVTGQQLRGFMLRRLRVNPLETQAVAVLDERHEAQAEQALAAGPAGVVLLADGRMLSPRQVIALHGRLRDTLGADVPVIWLVFALREHTPVSPGSATMRRWARVVDSLRDPAVEVVAYDA